MKKIFQLQTVIALNVSCNNDNNLGESETFFSDIINEGVCSTLELDSLAPNILVSMSCEEPQIK